MSANTSRVEVLWSPIEDNTFITCGSAINLYQVDGPTNPHYSKHPESSLKVAEQKYAVHCATNSEIHYIKCAAWYPQPEPKNLLAVGQANGRVVLTSFGDPGEDELIGKEFVPRHSRHCNYLAWNPEESHFLAEGLEKFRNDACIVIWDVTATHALSESSERSRYSCSEHGSISRPYSEIGAGDTSSSFAWFDSRTFFTGMNNRYLRLYDLRDPSKSRLTTQHRTVSGVCVDVHNPNRLASFGESQVAVWDVKKFDRPVFTLQEAKPVSKISWCLTRSGVLTVLCKDSPSLRLYDIRHAMMGTDDIEPVVIDRSVQPCGELILSSFAWHPKDENRLLAAAGPSHISDVTVFERIPMAWSPNSSLTWANGKRTMNCVEEGQLNTQDIATRMRHRALNGYGMQNEDMESNAKVVAEEPHLQGVWKWITLVRQPQLQRVSQGKRGGVYNMGVKQLVKYYAEQSNPMSSDLVYVNWQAFEGVKFNIKQQYRSAERSLALSLCGWVPDTNPEFSQHLDMLVENGQDEKAAAIAVFFLKMKTALEILSTSAANNSDNGNMNLNAMAMAVAGYNENSNTMWRHICCNQLSQLSSPYLRAIFAFLASDAENYEDVLNEKGMSVEDRVGFALTYLPDAPLKDYINRLSEELVNSGDLDGMLLTGMSSEGIDLLERYVDKTSDVQTAAVIAVFSGTAQAIRDERVNTWIHSYKTLLDQWALWHQRSQFDIVSQNCEPGVPHPPQVYINCNFCGKSITSNRGGYGIANRFMQLNPFSNARSPQQQRQKISCCPSCRKALPRCAVCLGTLGTASAFDPTAQPLTMKSSPPKLTPFQDWFAWCQTCRHGGHAAHISQWFREHADCPVTGCACKCMTIDSTDKVSTSTS